MKVVRLPQSFRPQILFLLSVISGVILGLVVRIPFDHLVSYFLGISWVSLILHPGAKTYVGRPQYRWSLVRTFYLLDQKITLKNNGLENIIRILPPIVFTFLLYIFSGQGSVLWCAIGASLIFLFHQFCF